MKKCFIMRGIPGSGKSHWLKNHVSDTSVICSADHYFVRDGVYRFDISKIKEAHDYCLRRFVSYVLAEATLIAVDNTNVRAYEIAPYYRMAEAFGYQVEIIWVVANLELCVQRTVHGVPREVVERMQKSFEPIPDWWSMRLVYN